MASFSLLDIVPDIPVATIIDVGAMMLPGETAFCKPLMDRGAARVICFEPNEGECRKLNDILRASGGLALPHFVGDGRERTFYETTHTMTGSLYEPNTAYVDRFHYLGAAMGVVKTHPVRTVRLDDIAEVAGADLLKMDVQGAEVDVLMGAGRVLDQVGIVQSEVCFVELYKGQCLFADVDRLLRAKGFMFHTFRGLAGRPLKPLVIGGDPNRPFQQQMWSDAVYIRSFDAMAAMGVDRLLTMALLLHQEYHSYDFCHYVLGLVDRFDGGARQASYMTALGRT